MLSTGGREQGNMVLYVCQLLEGGYVRLGVKLSRCESVRLNQSPINWDVQRQPFMHSYHSTVPFVKNMFRWRHVNYH
jgi:hypothetical protein